MTNEQLSKLKNQAIDCAVDEVDVRIYFDQKVLNKTPIFCRFAMLEDAEDLLSKNMVRAYDSRTVDNFTELGNKQQVEATRIYKLDTFTDIKPQ